MNLLTVEIDYKLIICQDIYKPTLYSRAFSGLKYLYHFMVEEENMHAGGLEQWKKNWGSRDSCNWTLDEAINYGWNIQEEN